MNTASHLTGFYSAVKHLSQQDWQASTLPPNGHGNLGHHLDSDGRDTELRRTTCVSFVSWNH
jgi:hypothetical protein